MSKNKPEVDCTSRCRSRTHGQAITSAITKRSVQDKALAAFIKGTCSNFIKAFDFEGRTALHMAASRGRVELMEWLIRHSSEAFINARDRESGSTPLHRCVFYGQIHAAVSLMKIGVNTDIVDKDDYRALDHALLDRTYMYKHDSTQPCDAYVWGTNTNYTLGTGSNQPKHAPDMLAAFSRANISVKQVCLGKFHSVWLCSGPDSDVVWCCGQLARAGAPHGTALRPTALKVAEPCAALAITLNSTVILLESGLVLQYTLNNTDNVTQSSIKSSIRLPSIKPLIKVSNALGVCAGRSHAVVWNKNAVYTWGVNLGQLGHSQEDKVIQIPKRIAISMNNKEEAGIELVDACDAATVLTTSRGDVYLLHRYICKKIAIKQINLRQVCVEAKVSEQGAYSRVTVVLLTNIGQLLLWQDSTNKLTRCVFGLAHQISITHVALTHDGVYFTTKHGEAYSGTISRKAPPTTTPQPIKKEKEKCGRSALVKFLEKDDCTSVKINKVPNVHRAVSVAVDNEGLNFAVLQTKPICGLTSVPELSPSCMAKHMESLREMASHDDILHDVVFQVGPRQFPAHIFVIASNSDLLYKQYQDHIKTPGLKPTITVENVHPEAFERVLKFMYTGTCDVVETGPCGLKIRREDVIAKKEKDKDIELEEVDNPSEINAFDVYKKQENAKGKKGGRNNKRSTETPPRPAHAYLDPVKLVQAAAKRLQVMSLHKLLEKFYYRDGRIYLKEHADYQKTPPHWSRETLPELVDTNVCSKDGMLVPAHKCVLAARLDYFHGMFMHSWTESKLLSKVTLPINYGILLPVINFLYTDTCPEIESSESIDFICNMLIVADQLFITRLREMCEVSLANLMTLKNCAELCQFAHTYNATQLKQFCMQFISLNLTTILENRCLDLLEQELMEDITKYYCKFNPIMHSRVITPFYNAPSDEVIEKYAAMYPVELNYIDEEIKRDDSLIDVPRKKNKQKKIEYTVSEKERMRYESVSSVTSLDLSNEVSGDITLSLSKIKDEKGTKDKQEKWIEVPTSLKQQKIVQARLKAISKAKDILNEVPSESIYVPLQPTSRMSVSPKKSPSSPKDFAADFARSPQGNLIISHIGPKLSQKQRKKLASQGEGTSQSWTESLSKITIGSPEKPKNPWKICAKPVASSSPKAKAMHFDQILTDQKKQKEDHSRIMTKPLAWTQLEDKAIEQLEKFYNAQEADEEMITVKRIELQIYSPQWIHTAPN